ncbi:ApbE family protein [Kiritimatiellaeota bacterium B1221]|nr:ApbE family protein [Kiritimatiellaeota bacterium B1221]
MTFLILIPIVLAVLLICVLGMSVGVLNGRKPIQHCGSSSRQYKGQEIDCPLCSNKKCPNEKKGACTKGSQD